MQHNQPKSSLGASLKLSSILIMVLSIAIILNLNITRSVIMTIPKTVSRFPDDAAVIRTRSLAKRVRGAWLLNENVTIVLNHDQNSSFFFIEDRPQGGIDPIRAFLHSSESTIRELYHHLLFEPNCRSRDKDNAWGAVCASRENSRERIVVDVGANRGYYTLLSATYGHRVLAFDPQPHCVTLLEMSVLINGFEHSVEVHNKYVSDNPKEKMEVRKRTGCTGTFPNDNDSGWADGFRAPLRVLPGADDIVYVDGVALDDIISADAHDILLLKVDVEGFETHVFNSAKKLISAGAIHNIVFEINAPMLKRMPEGLKKGKERVIRLIKWLSEDLGYKSKCSGRGHWKYQTSMNVSEWSEIILSDGLVTVDAWFTRRLT